MRLVRCLTVVDSSGSVKVNSWPASSSDPSAPQFNLKRAKSKRARERAVKASSLSVRKSSKVSRNVLEFMGTSGGPARDAYKTCTRHGLKFIKLLLLGG